MNEFFDKIYLINLKKRKDRLDIVSAELAKHGIVFTRVVAVDGKELKKEQANENFCNTDGFELTAVSMTLSAIFHDAVSREYDKILILEDDVEFYNLERFYEAIKEIPETFDLFYLGAHHKQEAERYSKNLVRLKESYLCHAVGFGKEAIKYLSSAIMNVSNELIYSAIQAKRMNSFCVFPNVAFQRRDLSDISGMVANYDGLLEKEKSLSKL